MVNLILALLKPMTALVANGVIAHPNSSMLVFSYTGLCTLNWELKKENSLEMRLVSFQ